MGGGGRVGMKRFPKIQLGPAVVHQGTCVAAPQCVLAASELSTKRS